MEARSADGKRSFVVAVALFRQEDSSLFLIRISSLKAKASEVAVPKAKSQLLKIVERAPEGFVVTDPKGSILVANRAFLDLAQLATEQQARGESIDRWLGRPGVELNVLLKNLKEYGSVRLFSTILHGEHGSTSDIELSAVSVLNGEPPCLGFMIRNIGRRLSSGDHSSKWALPHSVEQLTELVGRVPLKDLVRETTDIIEQLCIEAALELTGDNRASAAEVLGLSRQSLYVKLKRYGLADAVSDNEH